MDGILKECPQCQSYYRKYTIEIDSNAYWNESTYLCCIFRFITNLNYWFKCENSYLKNNYKSLLGSISVLIIAKKLNVQIDIIDSASSLLRKPEIKSPVNTLRPGQDGRHVPDDIFKCIFLNENVWIFITISPKFVPKGWISNIPALVRIMAWRRPCDKPLSEPMMV